MTPTPYASPETEQLAAVIADAARAEKTAADWLAKATDARAALNAAQDRFAETLSESDAKAVATAIEYLRTLAPLSEAIDNFGGPARARWRVLHSPQAWAILAKGAERKLAELERVVPRVRKTLGATLAALTEAGKANPSSEPEAVRLNGILSQIEAMAGALRSVQSFCSQRPQKIDRDFGTLHGSLIAPIPTL